MHCPVAFLYAVFSRTASCCALTLSVLKVVVSVQATYGVAASTWTLPEHDKIPITEEKDFQTGFLVHMAPIGRLMEWCGRPLSRHAAYQCFPQYLHLL